MTIDDVRAFLSTYNPDHYPEISFGGSSWDEHFYLDDTDDTNHISIVKFPIKHYNGNWEVFSPALFDDVYRSPTLAGILDFLLSIHPGLLYSKANYPEYFL